MIIIIIITRRITNLLITKRITYTCKRNGMLLQVIIVEFGSYAFSTVSLTTDQWLWCLLFGCGELIWGQVSITSFSDLE